jgi:hypothetical protein
MPYQPLFPRSLPGVIRRLSLRNSHGGTGSSLTQRPRRASLAFQTFQWGILRQLTSEPPSQTRFDDFIVKNATIWQDHFCNREFISGLSFGLDFDFLLGSVKTGSNTNSCRIVNDCESTSPTH